MIESLKKEILQINKNNFDELALEVFQFQAINCKVYNQYLAFLDIDISKINSIEAIPFLPISFFKTKKIVSTHSPTQTVFKSSGTTGLNTSQHFLADPEFYKDISKSIFEANYGSLENYHIVAMLPSYLERGDSSLIYMVQHFIDGTNSPYSGFYTADYQAIINLFDNLKLDLDTSRKVLLWGVTFAMLDLAELGYDFSTLKDRLIVLETGGMKGRKKEIVRDELYQRLKTGFGVGQIHSEYGMTELLSQAYSSDDALFNCPNSMKILLRELNDPFAILPYSSLKKSGGINVIDLANLETCSFIETQDLGQYGPTKDSFKVLGRFDNSDLRGCNLLIE
jgi:hypothetical protein